MGIGGFGLSIGQGGGSSSSASTRLVNAVQGGMINSTSLQIAGSKTTFKGRRKYRFGLVAPLDVSFVFLNWYIQGNTANQEVAGANAIPITKAMAYITDATGNQLGTPAGVGVGASTSSRSFTVPAAATEFLTDTLYPIDFGLQAFPAFGFIEYRGGFTLSGSLRAPASDQTFFGWSQSYRATAAITDDVDAFGVMAENTGSADAINVFMPSYVLGHFPISFPSLLLLGDSMFSRQNDFPGLGDRGGGLAKRAAYLSGLPYFAMSVGGRQTSHQLNSPKCKSIYGRFTDTVIQLGTNDIGLSAAADVIGSYLLPNMRTIWADLRAAGHRRIFNVNLPPRTVDNEHKCTDLAQMSPYVTAATVAAGAPRDGYGFGAGEARDIWNGTTLPAEMAAGRIDAIVDVASSCQDPTTTWKWKVPTFAATVSSAISIGSSATVSLDTSPPILDSLVFEPGNVANVDLGGQGGPYVQSVTGTGPYTAAISAANAYTGAAAGNGCAKNHAAGTVVKSTIGSDGTHPTAAAYVPVAALLAPKLRALTAL